VAGCATSTGFAGHASATAASQLTFHLGHSMGADQFAGGINIWRGGYLDPGVAFDLITTINAQIAPILGGIYTLPGPIIGSIMTVALGEITRLALGNIVGASLLLYGALLVVIVLALPNGLYGAFSARHGRTMPRLLAKLRPSRSVR
jgi:ABC-type branched-subunit amino acid transport system permease subunit